MKRTRPERPSGRPRRKERRVCTWCGRSLGRLGASWRPAGREEWRCFKCGVVWVWRDGWLYEAGGCPAMYGMRSWVRFEKGLLVVGGDLE